MSATTPTRPHTTSSSSSDSAESASNLYPDTDPYGTDDLDDEHESETPAAQDASSSQTSQSDTDNEKGVNWTTKDAILLVTQTTAERICLKFQNTKKSHIHIWNEIAKELSKTPSRPYTGKQCRTKFNHLKSQYMNNEEAESSGSQRF